MGTRTNTTRETANGHRGLAPQDVRRLVTMWLGGVGLGLVLVTYVIPESDSEEEPVMAPETFEQISTLVRSGFYPKEILMEILCEEMYAPGELDPAEVSSALDAEFQKLSTEQASWPDVTDCDRLDIVFAALNARGIVALQNAGYTQDDGYDEVWEAYPDAADDEHTIGYCFYHRQDMERAVRGGGLCLAFGPVEPADEATKGHEAGRIIKQELERVGFHVEWDGTFKQRILIPTIDWKRRLSDETS